jgi:chromate transport protein ChrA
MHATRLNPFAPGIRFRWTAVLIVAGIAGCFPFTISSVPACWVRVILTIFLGFLISRWWTKPLVQLSLAFAVSLLCSLVCVLFNSFYDGLNWFALLYLTATAGGVSDAFFRQQLVIVFCAVWATVLMTVVFTTLLRPNGANKTQSERG